ncbi:MAG: HAD family hydrolase [Desulfovibrionaceae bacterium]
MQQYKALVFDFDGTLAHLTIDFDSMKRKLAALAEGFLGERPEAPAKPALEWLDDLAAEIAEYEGRDLGLEFHCRGRLVVQATELDAAARGGLFPFTRDLLGELRSRGVATGIITRNSTAAVRVVFPDVREQCDVFLPREDVPAVKPHPEHLLEALRRMGAEPGRALMVGDHALDLETGRRAGVRTAGVAGGNMTLEELERAGADHLAQDAAGLVAGLRAAGLLA